MCKIIRFPASANTIPPDERLEMLRACCLEMADDEQSDKINRMMLLYAESLRLGMEGDPDNKLPAINGQIRKMISACAAR